ncbi:MAG: ABC transporter substrate-binding protein [Deltaproteobacteria bacterium]|nr:ABC transporter substrate-binding protein [Deltaproteobacteria bacterium]MBW2307351.1 ABC transporter substrate-binding protein [Deltaproteobacteria bacterium]
MKKLHLWLSLAIILAIPISKSHVMGGEKVFRYVDPWSPKGLDNLKSGFVFLRMGCLETLVTADYDFSIVPMLASSWKVETDGLTWIFNLREGVRFHDGSPLIAKTVVKNLERARKKKGALSKAPIASMEAKSPKIVIIRTRAPFSPLPAYLAHYSSTILGEKSFDAEGNVARVVGTGPFQMTGRRGNEEFYFSSYPGYWGKKASISKLVYHAVKDGQTRALMAEKGESQISGILAPSAVGQLRAAPNVEVLIKPIPRTRLIVLNCGTIFFSDKRVRQAVSYAIDRKAIVDYVLEGLSTPATQLIPPTLKAWYHTGLSGYSHDLARANELLEEAGWQRGPDGVRVKEGRRFKVEMRTYATRPALPLIAEAVQAQLKNVGIEVKIVIGRASRIPEGQKDGSLQMALLARNLNLVPDPDGVLMADYHSSRSPGWGAMGWKNTELDRLIEESREAFVMKERRKKNHRILEILNEEVPVVVLNYFEQIVAVQKDVKGYRINPSELSYHLENVRW